MQSNEQNKIENMAARIYETGHTYRVGDEIEWLGPSGYSGSETIQRREAATVGDVSAAEQLAAEWAK